MSGGILRATGRQVNLSPCLTLKYTHASFILVHWRSPQSNWLLRHWYDTLVLLYVKCLFWYLGIPIGLVLTFAIPQWKLGLLGLWLGLSLALLWTSCVGLILCARTKWEEEVGRAKDRLMRGETVPAH